MRHVFFGNPTSPSSASSSAAGSVWSKPFYREQHKFTSYFGSQGITAGPNQMSMTMSGTIDVDRQKRQGRSTTPSSNGS